RDRSGEGTRLSVALYDTALAWSAYHIGGFIDSGFVPQPMGSELAMIAPYGAFPTADGELMIAAGNEGLFRRLCDALSLRDVPPDPRFATNAVRVAHRAEINALISARTTAFTTAALLALLRSGGVPCAPIRNIAQVSADEQTIASGMIAQGEGPTALRLPLRWDGARSPAGTAPPRPGEHSAGIRAELGLA